jgi:hypothetical protein
MRRLAGSLGATLLILLISQPAAAAAAPDTGVGTAVPSLMLEAGGSTGTHAFVASLDGVTPEKKARTPFGGQRRWLVADDGGNGNGEEGGESGEGDPGSNGDDDDREDGIDWWDPGIDLSRSEFRKACEKGKYIYLAPNVKKAFEKEFWAEFEEGVKVNMKLHGMTESEARGKTLKDREGSIKALYGRQSIILIKEIPKTGNPPNQVHLEALSWTKSVAIATGFSGYTPTEEEEKILKKIEVNYREIGILYDERRSLCTRALLTFAPEAVLRTTDKIDRAIKKLENKNEEHVKDLKKVWREGAAEKGAAKQKTTK